MTVIVVNIVNIVIIVIFVNIVNIVIIVIIVNIVIIVIIVIIVNIIIFFYQYRKIFNSSLFNLSKFSSAEQEHSI